MFAGVAVDELLGGAARTGDKTVEGPGAISLGINDRRAPTATTAEIQTNGGVLGGIKG